MKGQRSPPARAPTTSTALRRAKPKKQQSALVLSPPRDGRPSASLPSSARAAKPKAAGSLPLHLLGRRERAARYLVPLTCFFPLAWNVTRQKRTPTPFSQFSTHAPSPFRGGEHPHREWNGGKKITESGPRKLDACVLSTSKPGRRRKRGKISHERLTDHAVIAASRLDSTCKF